MSTNLILVVIKNLVCPMFKNLVRPVINILVRPMFKNLVRSVFKNLVRPVYKNLVRPVFKLDKCQHSVDKLIQFQLFMINNIISDYRHKSSSTHPSHPKGCRFCLRSMFQSSKPPCAPFYWATMGKRSSGLLWGSEHRFPGE